METTTVSFTSDLLEIIMIVTGTTIVRSGVIDGQYTIRVGNEHIQGPTREECFRKFFYFLLTKDLSASVEQLKAFGQEAKLKEDEEFQKKIEELTAGGMSEFGIWAQKMRMERGGLIFKAVQDILAEGKCKTTNELLARVRGATGVEDVELAEVALAYQDLSRIS